MKISLRTAWLATKIVSLLVLSASASIYLIRHSDVKAARLSGDLPGLLFGAVSLTLAAFAAVIAIAAIPGWQSLKLTIQERVDTAQKAIEAAYLQRLDLLQKEIRGRTFFGLGYMTGEMSIDPVTLKVKATDSSRLRDAILLCEQGYEFLRDVEGSTKFMALNNYVYYSCALGDDLKREVILDRARILKNAALEHDSVNLLLTAARAFLQYGSDVEKRTNREFILSLKKGNLTDKQLREADLYLTSLN